MESPRTIKRQSNNFIDYLLLRLSTLLGRLVLTEMIEMILKHIDSCYYYADI